MSSVVTERPRFFEGQYLGADDLKLLVDYLRMQDARHTLGLHTWGIAAGLELSELEAADGSIEVFIQPGYAFDGYGRPIVVLNPYKVPAQMLAKAATGLIPIWIRYEQQDFQGVHQGFEVCSCDDAFERIAESFAVEVGVRGSLSDRQSGITLGGELLQDARDAMRAFDDGAPLICDASVPHQVFPEDGERARWLIPVGYVNWQAGVPGAFLARNDDQRRLSRIFRRQAGLVTEAIHAANGLIRLRARTTESDGTEANNIVCERSSIREEDFDASAPDTLVFDDLVWIEGNLRIEGNARLFGSKLEFRDSDGKERNVPMYFRRSPAIGIAPDSQDLELVVGVEDKAQDNNRLLIGTVDGDGNHVAKVVITDGGKVGIGTPIPQNYFKDADDLVIAGASNQGITIASDKSGTGNIRFASGVAADAAQRGRITYDHVAGILSFGAEDNDPIKIIGDGNVGIGTDSPVAPLHIATGKDVKLANNSGYLVLGPVASSNIVMDNNEIQARNAGNHSTLHLQADGGGLVVNQHRGENQRVVATNEGRVGIGTSSPAEKLDVKGRIMRRSQDFTQTGTVNHNAAVSVPWGTADDWNIFVAPSFMGEEEPGSEADNALLRIECFASKITSTSWQITAQYKFKLANNQNNGIWKEGTANYLLVPK